MSVRYPWYDSPWLRAYANARAWLEQHDPHQVARLEDLVAPLRTDPDFEVITIDDMLDPETFHGVLEVVDGLALPAIDNSEISQFGRVVVWNEPRFTQLQKILADRVSLLVGEAVVPTYNFLSLYTAVGRCEPHMDAPHAKWTLDICLRQSRPWPICFSQVVPWPVDHDYGGPDWEDRIRQDPGLHFTSHAMSPGQSLLFAGSSQWHYRDPLPRESGSDFCDLLFLHYVPAGAEHLVEPVNWPGLLDVPGLADVIDPAVSSRR